MLSNTLRTTVASRLGERLRPLIESFGGDEIGSLVDLLVLVANADGKIDAAERQALQAGIEAIFGSQVVPMLVHRLVAESLERIEASTVDLQAVSVGAALAKLEHVEDGLRVAATVAEVSDGLSEPEHDLLVTIARAGGLCTRELDAVIEQVRAESAG
jgi:tellurite resistance protein